MRKLLATLNPDAVDLGGGCHHHQRLVVAHYLWFGNREDSNYCTVVQHLDEATTHHADPKQKFMDHTNFCSYKFLFRVGIEPATRYAAAGEPVTAPTIQLKCQSQTVMSDIFFCL
uniref:SFRICE_024145 n=1 Tax=Spodoptera frugiperda TaxID=7108 RepID=A0A2H1W3U1_SPOFR